MRCHLLNRVIACDVRGHQHETFYDFNFYVQIQWASSRLGSNMAADTLETAFESGSCKGSIAKLAKLSILLLNKPVLALDLLFSVGV